MRPALPWFLKTIWGEDSARIAVLLFLAIGLVYLWFLSLQPTLNWMRARSWQPVEAVIETAQVKTIRWGRTYRDELEVQFSYQHDGVAHTGTRHSFVRGSTNLSLTGMQEVVASLPPGKKVIAWANPRNPAESVLDRSWPAEAVFSPFIGFTPLITLGMTAVGFLALPLLRRRFRAKRQTQLEGLVATGRLPQWILRPFKGQRNKVALVTAADERLTQVLLWLFFNLVYNGPVGALVWAALVRIVHDEGGKELSASLVLIPFVAVGILLLWMLLTSCRCQRRPQWVAAVYLVPGFEGGTVKCCWAWLEENRSPHAPQAVVRLVAQAAHWNERSYSPAFGAGGVLRRKLLSPGRCRMGQRELDAVEIPLHSASGEISVTLPRMPSLPAETARQPPWMRPTTWAWCRWWQLEVTYRDGTIELADLTEAEKLLM